MGGNIGTEYSRTLDRPDQIDPGKQDRKPEIPKPSSEIEQQSTHANAIAQQTANPSKGYAYPPRPVGELPPPKSATAFSTDGRWMATCNRGHEIVLWDLKSANPSASIQVIRVNGTVSAVAFHPKITLLFAASIDPQATTILNIGSWQFEGEAIKFTPDPKHDKRIDISSKAPPTGEVWLAFSPDASVLSIRTDTVCELYDWNHSRFGDLQSSFPVGPNFPELTQIFSPDARWLLASSTGTDASLIALDQPFPSGIVPMSSVATGPGIWADFSRDSRLLVTAANDDSAHVVDPEQLIRERDPAEPPPPARIFPGLAPPVRLVRFDPNANQLVTVAGDGIIRVWRLDTFRLLEAAERVAGRNLTQQEWKQYFPGIPYMKTFTDLPVQPPSAAPVAPAPAKAKY